MKINFISLLQIYGILTKSEKIFNIYKLKTQYYFVYNGIIHIYQKILHLYFK